MTSFALYEAYGTHETQWGDDPDRQKANTKEEESDLDANDTKGSSIDNTQEGSVDNSGNGNDSGGGEAKESEEAPPPPPPPAKDDDPTQ